MELVHTIPLTELTESNVAKANVLGSSEPLNGDWTQLTLNTSSRQQYRKDREV
jgi:hypothetical protein